MKQGTAEWHKARTARLTASRLGAALGLNPWQSPDDLIRAMVRETHGAEPEFSGNIATRWGGNHEPLAMLDYMSEADTVVEECGFFVHPDYDWMGASPDGLVGKDGIVEIKCPFGQRDKNPPVFKTLAEQPHYFAQVQMELACSQREWADFYQWAPHGATLERVYIDPAWWAVHFPAMQSFYERYKVELDNPAHLRERTCKIEGKRYEVLLARYDELRRIEDEAKAERQTILDTLVDAAGNESAEVCGRKLTRVERVGAVAYSRVVKDLLPGVDLEPYRGESSTSWRLT